MIGFKQIWAMAQSVPALSNFIGSAVKKRRIDPIEALNVLQSLSPDFKRATDRAVSVVQNGGGAREVVTSLAGMGEINIFGQRVNPGTISRDLRQAGGVGNTLASIWDGLAYQSAEDIVKMGDQASDLRSWGL